MVSFCGISYALAVALVVKASVLFVSAAISYSEGEGGRGESCLGRHVPL